MAERRTGHEGAILLTPDELEYYKRLTEEFESEPELRGKIGVDQPEGATLVWGPSANDSRLAVRMIVRRAISIACGYSGGYWIERDERLGRGRLVIAELLLGKSHFGEVPWESVGIRDMGKYELLHRTPKDAIFEPNMEVAIFASEAAHLKAGRQIVTHHQARRINSDIFETVEVYRILRDHLVRFRGIIGE